MSDTAKINLASADEALLQAAATGADAVELTPELLATIGNSLTARKADIAARYPVLVEACSYETRLAVTAWVMDAIVRHAAEGGTFRYLIYERLGFGPDAYVPLHEAGGMTISNEFNMRASDDSLTGFADPNEVRRLLESLGASGEIATAADCALANPRTLPAITELVGRGALVFAERTTTITDIWRVTETGADLARRCGIEVAAVAASAAPAQTPRNPDAGLDPAATRALFTSLQRQVVRHLAQSPPMPAHVLEVLNALGSIAGIVIAGTGKSHDNIREFFRAAVDQELAVHRMAASEPANDARPPVPPGGYMLVIDDDVRAETARVIAHAAINPYRPGMPPPGDDPNYVCHFSGYRVVFSFTQSDDGRIYRHLSISVPDAPANYYPSAEAVLTIAQELFGFTGWDRQTVMMPDGWLLHLNEEEHCIAVAQLRDETADGAGMVH